MFSSPLLSSFLSLGQRINTPRLGVLCRAGVVLSRVPGSRPAAGRERSAAIGRAVAAVQERPAAGLDRRLRPGPAGRGAVRAPGRDLRRRLPADGESTALCLLCVFHRLRGQDTALCLAFPLPSWLSHRLCLAFPLPSWLRCCLCLAALLRCRPTPGPGGRAPSAAESPRSSETRTHRKAQRSAMRKGFLALNTAPFRSPKHRRHSGLFGRGPRPDDCLYR